MPVFSFKCKCSSESQEIHIHSLKPLQRSTRNSELFKLKFLLKLFFKSLKITLIINFFYILNILFFPPAKREKAPTSVNSDCQDDTMCCQLGRHLCNLHGDINILVWGFLLSEQILHCHKYHTLKPRYVLMASLLKFGYCFRTVNPSVMIIL